MDGAASPEDEMRILVVGDLHANSGSALETIDHAAEIGATHLVQVGDFGWWPRDPGGRAFHLKVERRLALHDLDLWWIDGNHEDFDRLATRPVGEDGRRQMSDHVWHLPRGYRWTWNGTTWLAVGGAVSVDKALRTEHETWFAAEELTGSEADRIVSGGPADVVVSHDAPLGVPFLRARLRQDLPAWRRSSEWPTGLIVRSDEHQRRVRSVVEGVGAGRVFHGHHHIRYRDVLSTSSGVIEVQGLGSHADSLHLRTCLVDSHGSELER